MSEIDRIKFDGVEVGRGEAIDAYWAKYHYITVYFVCTLPLEPCRESFEVYIDGKKVYETDVRSIPGAPIIPIFPPEPKPIDIIISHTEHELDPGTHTIKVKVIEHPLIGEPYPIDEYNFTVNILKSSGQEQPYERPPAPEIPWYTQLGRIPWYGWAAIFILVIAFIFRGFTRSPVEKAIEEIVELEKLKALKSLSK